jgi:hypothetical protein
VDAVVVIPIVHVLIVSTGDRERNAKETDPSPRWPERSVRMRDDGIDVVPQMVMTGTEVAALCFGTGSLRGRNRDRDAVSARAMAGASGRPTGSA